MRLLILTILIFNITMGTRAQNKPIDSTLTLSPNILKEFKNLGDHGVDFFKDKIKVGNRLDSTDVAKDFYSIKDLSDIDIKKYNLRIFKEGKHQIKIFESIDKKRNPFKIIEIVTTDSTVNKRIPITQYNYLILSSATPKIISVLIDENGIESYSIQGKKVFCLRESVLYIDDKYDYIPFMEVDSIIQKYR